MSEGMIRPVRCHVCQRPMFYMGQPGHESEVRVTVENRDAGEDHVIYVHVACWNERMETKK